jgi:hypothetical protein
VLGSKAKSSFMYTLHTPHDWILYRYKVFQQIKTEDCINMEFYNWFKLISYLLISTCLSIFPKKIQFSSKRKKNKYIQALILVLIPSKWCQFRTRSQELKPRVEHFNKGGLPTLVITHNLQKPATSYRETDHLFNNCLHLTGKNFASIASILMMNKWEELGRMEAIK